MKAIYASSREINNAMAALDDGEELTPRQKQIVRAGELDCLHVHDERPSKDVQYAGGGYDITSTGSYREHFCS